MGERPARLVSDARRQPGAKRLSLRPGGRRRTLGHADLHAGEEQVGQRLARRIVEKDVVLGPVVGFDDAHYRLGNGGGYFDRSLAILSPKPLTIGVGYEFSRLDTIHPKPHDQRFDIVVTEASIRR